VKPIAVIGAGPAGMTAAFSAAEHLKNRSQGMVCLFEKQPQTGLKLCITGSGQCNLTHASPAADISRSRERAVPDPDEAAEFLSRYSSRQQSRFLKHAYYQMDNRELMRFITDLGVAVTVRSDGKVFPRSLQAADVRTALEQACRLSGVVVKTGFRVTGIQRGAAFTLTAGRTEAEFSAVIIACGGKSYPHTGSDGDGYRLAQSLGHSIIPPQPALCAVCTEPHPLSSLSGLSFTQAAAEHWRERENIGTYRGDLLITHRGFSGPLIIHNSRRMKRHDRLLIDFTGKGELFLEELRQQSAAGGKRHTDTVLHSAGIPLRLVRKALAAEEIDGKLPFSQISRGELYALFLRLTRWEHTVSSSGSFSQAMVTAGGVMLTEVNPRTLESRITPGLYFAGEVLDIDGDTGGYNLQAAFSTGRLAGKSAAAALLSASPWLSS
jgi:predicted Rossmann fold flavoprotein